MDGTELRRREPMEQRRPVGKEYILSDAMKQKLLPLVQKLEEEMEKEIEKRKFEEQRAEMQWSPLKKFYIRTLRNKIFQEIIPWLIVVLAFALIFHQITW